MRFVNPYENERINNVNLFISQYCAYRDTDVAAISLEDMKQLLRSGIGELYDYTYEDEMREVEEAALNEDGEEVTALREVTVRVYSLTYRARRILPDSIFHLTAEQKTPCTELCRKSQFCFWATACSESFLV